MCEIKFEFLNSSNVGIYIDYLKTAFKEEPELICCDFIDEKGIRARILDEFYMNTKSILAIVDEKVVGRLEYHFYGCIQDGYKMCYVDWLYILRDYRKRGIATKLFLELENECEKKSINQYYLLCATNENADKFYSSFKDVEIKDFPVLRKYLR